MATAQSDFITLPVREKMLGFLKKFLEAQGDFSSQRARMEYQDRVFQMSVNQTAEQVAALRRARDGRSSTLPELVVPIAMPQVESAVAHQAGVFLTGFPIFGMVAPPKFAQQAQQMEALLSTQSIQFGWARELVKVFRNGFKYDFGPALCTWRQAPTQTISTRTEAAQAGLAQVTASLREGTQILALDPYNVFYDKAVDPADHHTEGTLVGWNKLYTRMGLRRLVQELDPAYTSKLKEAYESTAESMRLGNSGDAFSIFVPAVNPMASADATQDMNWGAFCGLDTDSRINYRNNYIVTNVFFRAMPSDFQLRGNTPEIYHLIIVNWTHVIFAQRVATPNDYLPVVIMKPQDDMLGLQSQSLVDLSNPFQAMASTLWNSAIQAKRRAVFDRLLYNPRYINKEDIDPNSPVARIPVRNAAQLDNLAKALYQIPFRDDSLSSSLQFGEMIAGMADVATGQNRVDRGQFQRGNKTALEFQTTMAGSNSRALLTSIAIEHQFMTPIKEMVKHNALVRQGTASIFDPVTRNLVEVNPVELRQALLQFKVTDGLLPADKLMSPELLTVFLQTAQAIPEVMSEYDIMGMFIYWMRLKGASWLDDFKRDEAGQQQFLSLLRQTQQANSATDPVQQMQPA